MLLVIPVKTGIQETSHRVRWRFRNILDSGLRRNDGLYASIGAGFQPTRIPSQPTSTLSDHPAPAHGEPVEPRPFDRIRVSGIPKHVKL